MVDVLPKIGATALMIGAAAFMSSMLFPPGNVPRQLLVVAFWYAAGFVTAQIWR